MGALCGYVGVTQSHPHFGENYDAPEVEVHGGLTFADRCQGDSEADGICHKADGTDDVWWFGFDCLHCGDSSPPILEMRTGHRALFDDGVYRDISYVAVEVTRLAAQLKALEATPTKR